MIYVPFISFFFACALLALIGFASTKVERNSAVGFKNKYTLQSDYVWREINARSGRSFGWLGTVLAILSLMSIAFPANMTLYILAVLLIAGVACLAVYYHLMSKKLFLSQREKGEESVIEIPVEIGDSSYKFHLEVIPLLIIIGTILSTYLMYADMPDRIPIHLGFTGKPDRWSDKTWFTSSIFILVQITVYTAVSVYFALVKKGSSGRYSQPSYLQIFYFKTLLVFLFGIVQHGFTSGLFIEIAWLSSIWVPIITIVFPSLILVWILKGLPFRKGGNSP